MRYSIDPGAQHCYCVEWRDGKIIGARVASEPLPVTSTDLLVCEEMRVRPGGKYAQDLVAVSQMSGRVCALGSVKYVAPEVWKGQVPKEIHQRTRILPRLSEQDLAILKAAVGRKPSLLHNMIDAAGIGLWYTDTQGAK